MCGICLIAGPNTPARDDLSRMVAALEHRGPDAAGLEQVDGCGLGHRRLSIIDLTTGAQPMEWGGGRYWLTFNGEIYNYRELREDLLARGESLRTDSDSEVILAAYATWGAAMLHRLRGMFAFAIWDRDERRLFAARDLFGEKPFYYAMAGDAFVGASELDALMASGRVKRAVDRDAIDAYLAVGYIPPDRTIYRGVHTLPPGHYLEWECGAQPRTTRYWEPRPRPRSISVTDAGERLRELLAQSVRRQMVADVPVGAFLSGGLDSSTIVALMQKQSAQPVMTFSVGFGDIINELPYARAVADQYGTDHHEIDLGNPDPAAMLEKMARVYDEPFSDSSNIPTYLLSGFARQHVKVVLTGDGGDELFGGYGWYLHLAMAQRTSAALLQWLVLRTMSKVLCHRFRALELRSSAAGLAARWRTTHERTFMSQVHFRAADRCRLWGGRNVTRYSPGEYYAPPAGTSGLDEAFHFDLMHYMPGDILVKVDRAAMAHGLETRAPFLDRDVAEFALSLPENLKVRDGQLKYLLREACQRYWPPELHDRPKQGFGAPALVWLRQPSVQELVRRVLAPGSKLRALLPGLREEDAAALTYRTWILLVLGLWLEAREVTLP